MKIFNSLLLTFIISLPAGAQFTDNFSDGNFTSNPAWVGNDTDFTVSVGQLRLNSSGTDTSYLSIANTYTLNNCEWNFWVRLNFSPSSNNFGRVYLVSDQENTTGSLNGYYLQFGETLSADAIELFRQTGTTSTSVLRSTDSLISSAFAIRVKITRDNMGLWNLFVDYTGGTNYVLEASGTDNTIATTNFFGVYCKYTTANSTRFYFDDFYVGPIIIDATPPVIDSVNVTSANTLDVFFNEKVDLTTSQTAANYSASNGLGNPTAAVRNATNTLLVQLTFATNFQSGITNVLTTNNVQDAAGNVIAASSNTFVYYAVQSCSPNDIVINEIMPEPKDNGVEWVEIYNRSNKAIDLSKLTLCSQDTITNTLTEIKTISSGVFLIYPGEYYVLSSSGTSIKSQYSTTDPNGFIHLSSIPALSNDGDIVVIADTSQTIIDKLIYTSDWYFPLLNSTKGFSLERIDFDRPTQDKTNWHTCAQSVEATPAYRNSQYSKGDIGNEVELSPEIFSPDNDGYNDVLNISYQFETAGMIANVTIYDSKGRLIRTILRNELLGINGTFSWDGITDDKQKARIGIYIIYFEAYNSEGKVKKYKKSCVLAGKL